MKQLLGFLIMCVGLVSSMVGFHLMTHDNILIGLFMSLVVAWVLVQFGGKLADE